MKESSLKISSTFGIKKSSKPDLCIYGRQGKKKIPKTQEFIRKYKLFSKILLRLRAYMDFTASKKNIFL